MPLIKSGSKRAVSANIAEMMKSGYPQKQAVAASLSNQRRFSKKAPRAKTVKAKLATPSKRKRT